MSPERAKATNVLGVVAVVVGAVMLIAARGEDFAYPSGVRLWRLLHMSMAGAIATLAIGVIAIVAARKGSRVLAKTAGALFAAVAAFTLVTLGTDATFTGGRADTVAFWMALSLGLLALTLTPEDTPGDA
jgi:uncharacterized membrane protein